MMTIGSFNSSFHDVEILLKNIGFLRQRSIKVINDTGVSDEFKIASQKQDYFKAYHAALKNYDFDFLLPDQSFFQFEFKSNKAHGFQDIRFAFFQNPQQYKSYGEYLEMLREEQIIGDETENDVGDLFHDEYEQFLTEQQFNISATTIRYDVDVNNYRPLIHSVAHIHIGYKNDIRIPCDKILTPLKFALFVIKHSYYNSWRFFIESKNIYIENSIQKAKLGCESLTPDKWIDLEKKELFFN